MANLSAKLSPFGLLGQKARKDKAAREKRFTFMVDSLAQLARTHAMSNFRAKKDF